MFIDDMLVNLAYIKYYYDLDYKLSMSVSRNYAKRRGLLVDACVLKIGSSGLIPDGVKNVFVLMLHFSKLSNPQLYCTYLHQPDHLLLQNIHY